MDVVKTPDSWIARLQDGEDFFEQLGNLNISAGVIVSGIGMMRDVTLAFWNGSEYIEHDVKEPAELLSLQGNFSVKDGKPFVHCHVVLGRNDGSVCGGHLMQATVNETNEIIISTLNGIAMGRQKEPSGLFGLTLREQ